MEHSTTKEFKVTIGLDLGDKKSHVVCVDREGDLIREDRIRTTPASFEKYFQGFSPSRVAIEVGSQSPWISRLIEKCGHEVIVSNPRQIPLIFKNQHKTDRADAENLARLARVDPRLLHPVQHRNKEAQKDLAMIRSRDVLVRIRTQLVNHARSLAKSFGERFPSCSAPAFHRKVKEAIPDELRSALEPVLAILHELTAKIAAFDRKTEKLCEESYPETKCLRQVSGVGPLTSLAFVLTLEDPQRFKKSRKVGPYLGLIPRKDDSGERESQLRITKGGDNYLRRLLVGCAQYILGPFGPDTDLRRYGEAIAQRGGKNARKRAAVAVARKLAVLMHRLWVTGEVYDPLKNANRKQQVKAVV